MENGDRALSIIQSKTRLQNLKKPNYQQLCLDLYDAILHDLREYHRCTALEKKLAELKDEQNDILLYKFESLLFIATLCAYNTLVKNKSIQSISALIQKPYVSCYNILLRWEELDRRPVTVPAVDYRSIISDIMTRNFTFTTEQGQNLQSTSKRIHIDGPETPHPAQKSLDSRMNGTMNNFTVNSAMSSVASRPPEFASDQPDKRKPEPNRSAPINGIPQPTTTANNTQALEREVQELLLQASYEVNRNATLHKQLQALKAENDQTESILKEAQNYQKTSRVAADNEATNIIIEARKAADEIKDDARKVAERVRQDANTLAEQRLSDAENEAQGILNEAHRKAEEDAGDLVKRYLRRELAEQSLPMTGFSTDREKETGISKENAADGTYRLESSLRTQLDKFKYEMQETLNNWRRDLYGQEFGPLARFYQMLYRQLGSGSKTVQTIASQITRVSSMQTLTEEDNDLLTRLGSLQKELESLVSQLGKVMGGLGLEIVLPKPGDPFDRELHIDEEADSGEETVAGVIETVRYPAVCGKDAAGERLTIRAAAVTVNNSVTAGDDK